MATLKNSFQNSTKPPSLCTKYLPEFSGKQQKLKDFFKTSDRNTKICHSKDECDSRIDGNANLGKVSDGKEEMPGLYSRPRNSEKRSSDSALKSQAKRLKTNSGVSSTQGKILNFFGKKSSSPKTDSNEETERGKISGLMNKNESDVIEEASTTLPHNVGLDNSLQSTNSSSQTSSPPSTCCSSGYSSSQNPTDSITEETEHGQIFTKGQAISDQAVISSWKNLLKGLPPAPPCSGHNEPCVLRTVKNKGPNHGKKFYCCARPQGHSTNKEARCNYFKWVKK